MNRIKEQRCPSCGGPLRFDPTKGWLVCDHCGAEVIAPTEQIALTCPYCGNNIVLTDKVSGRLRPDGVLPFRIDAAHLPEAMNSFYRDKVLLPKNFFSESTMSKVTGVYVPFWLRRRTASSLCMIRTRGRRNTFASAARRDAFRSRFWTSRRRRRSITGRATGCSASSTADFATCTAIWKRTRTEKRSGWTRAPRCPRGIPPIPRTSRSIRTRRRRASLTRRTSFPTPTKSGWRRAYGSCAGSW